MCLYGDLTRIRVYVLIRYFGTCAGESIIDVFHFAFERFICCYNKMS